MNVSLLLSPLLEQSLIAERLNLSSEEALKFMCNLKVTKIPQS